MNYELCRRLKEAGFPQLFLNDGTTGGGRNLYPPNTKADLSNITEEDFVYNPTLSELIAACSDDLMAVHRDRYGGTYLPGGFLDDDKDVYVALSWMHKCEFVFGSDLVAPGEDFENHPYGVGYSPEQAVANFYLALKGVK